MTERRSSLKARGAEILLGSPQALGTARREPAPAEPSPVEFAPQVQESALEGEPVAIPPLEEEPGAVAAEAPLPEEESTLVEGSAELAAAGSAVPEPESAEPGTPEAPADLETPEASAEPEAPEPAEPVLPPGGDAEAAEALPAPDDAFGPAFYEETLAAESAPGAEDAWVSEIEWPPTPEQELALFEEARQADDAFPAMAAAAAPAVPEAAAAQPDLSGAVLAAGLASAAPEKEESPSMNLTADIQTPEEEVEPYELPERPLPEDERKALVEAEDPRMKELDAEITQTYHEVVDTVGENESIANECFNQLLKARDVLLRRDVARLAQAEYYVEQVRARLKRAAASKAGARRHAWWITIWGFVWAVVYVGALVMLDSRWVTDFIDQLQLNSRFVDPSIFLPAMAWGGLGGVVAIWYSLFKHVSARDFDSYYNISYIGKPFFGLILGATVYMVVQLIIVSLGIWPETLPEGVVSPTIAPWIIYLLAWAGGFKENRIFGVVDLVMKRIFSSEETATIKTQGSPVG